MYTKGGCLFFGLSAMNSFRSNLRASRKPRLISSSLYTLSIKSNLSRDASRLSGSNFVRILEIHGSFYEPWDTDLGWPWRSMTKLLCVSWFAAYFDTCIRLSLWIFCLCTPRYPGMWFLWVMSCVWISGDCGSCLQFGSLLHQAQVLSPLACTHYL